MIFVDTGAWFALCVPSDADHAAATSFLKSNPESLITTNFVVDELLTLFRVRRERARALQWIDRVYGAKDFQLETVTDADFQDAIAMYQKFSDKAWSFTDCTSFVVISRLGLTRAFSFDDHFRQPGRFSVVP